jgi:hypothetical protein
MSVLFQVFSIHHAEYSAKMQLIAMGTASPGSHDMGGK